MYCARLIGHSLYAFFLGRLVHAVQFSKDAVHHHFVADSGDLLASCICTVDNVDALRIVSR